MSYSLIGKTTAAGNTVFATVYTQPATGTGGVIGNLSVHNTTLGVLTLTVNLVRQDGIATQMMLMTVSAGDTSGFGVLYMCPLSLLPGESIQAKGSGPGLNITVSGIAFS